MSTRGFRERRTRSGHARTARNTRRGGSCRPPTSLPGGAAPSEHLCPGGLAAPKVSLRRVGLQGAFGDGAEGTAPPARRGGGFPWPPRCPRLLGPAWQQEGRPLRAARCAGSSGIIVRLSTNHFRLTSRPQWALYQYHVDYNPLMEARRLRSALLFQHEDLIGRCHAFDGTILFLPKRLQHKVFQVSGWGGQGGVGSPPVVQLPVPGPREPSRPVCRLACPLRPPRGRRPRQTPSSALLARRVCRARHGGR